jgi:hypothetical protein
MAWAATAIVGGSIASGYLQGRASKEAAGAQSEASQAGIAEKRRQFEAVQELLAPYVEAGVGATEQQQALLGLGGPGEQAGAIEALQASPEFQALTQQGETGILQNAAATGGLRGGNVQEALAQFRPQLLSQLISQRFNRLGTVAGRGQASAAGQAAAAQATGTDIANLLAQQGQAQAGAALAQGQAAGNVAQTVGNVALLKQLKVF